eukprot:Blabericola_migrator_1__6441@NODE_324_length_9801_cov_109_610643_g261_i0_p1_GENE_NODE_324_length_9801_cov_109_610643_g261_i0NODE_324_length_9801_cov_109_610643_g261_i0_p1_ORF_typecomplete_len2030_score219_50zfHC5HC2H_2/PF13832_6/2_2e03zfHC5HC2H_2/PF13832_6/4_1e13zfHC5HC2H_2/PF13832_6/2_8e03zfHC5HC2H_2/PF13832_6/9e10zfHC5HC2H_2/PF13832_6/6e03zfHC5HC2H_2/PF13832_6/9_7e02zfHC5HC2H_2/PF13832_6/4_1e05PHD_2/PF13831_6/6_4e08PHD_2/PF13831_6/2_3e03PHD_2/PF13831_6/4_7e10PHD_2/PF13831_6/1_5e02PHD_2/PF13831
MFESVCLSCFFVASKKQCWQCVTHTYKRVRNRRKWSNTIPHQSDAIPLLSTAVDFWGDGATPSMRGNLPHLPAISGEKINRPETDRSSSGKPSSPVKNDNKYWNAQNFTAGQLKTPTLWNIDGVSPATNTTSGAALPPLSTGSSSHPSSNIEDTTSAEVWRAPPATYSDPPVFQPKTHPLSTTPPPASDDHRLPPLKPLEHPERHCQVCWSISAYSPPLPSGELITCGVCGVTVHEECYGGVNLSRPDQVWFCALCLYWIHVGVPRATLAAQRSLDAAMTSQEPTCSLCHRIRGAMKTGGEGIWIHVACVLFGNDGPRFAHPETRSTPLDVKKNLSVAAHSGYSCVFCKCTQGFPTKCRYPGCNNRIHVACAFLASAGDVSNFPRIFRVPFMEHKSGSGAQENYFTMITCPGHTNEQCRAYITSHQKGLMVSPHGGMPLGSPANTVQPTADQFGASTATPASGQQPSPLMAQPSSHMSPVMYGNMMRHTMMYQAPYAAYYGHPMVHTGWPGYNPAYAGYPAARPSMYVPGPYSYPQSASAAPGYPAPTLYNSANYSGSAQQVASMMAASPPLNPPQHGRLPPGPAGPSALGTATTPKTVKASTPRAAVSKPSATRPVASPTSRKPSIKREGHTSLQRGVTRPVLQNPVMVTPPKLQIKEDTGTQNLAAEVEDDNASSTQKRSKVGQAKTRKAGSVKPTTTMRKQRETASSPSAANTADTSSSKGEPDVGTAAGHVLGAAVTTKGFKVNWPRVSANFRPIKGADDALMVLFADSLKKVSNVRFFRRQWRWIWGCSEDGGSQNSMQVQALKAEWCRCCRIQNNGDVEALAPIAFLLTVEKEVASGEAATIRSLTSTPTLTTPAPAKQHLWLFCRSAPRPSDVHPLMTLPMPRLTAAMHSSLQMTGSGFYMQLWPSTSAFVSVDMESPSADVEFVQGLYLSDDMSYALRAELCAAESNEILSHASKVTDSVTSPAQCLRDVEDFSGYEDVLRDMLTTADDAASNAASKSLELTNWADMMRTEALVSRKAPHDFFILLKKVTTEAKLKEAIIKSLDPKALLRVVAVSKRVYLAKRIWELNPPFPAPYESFRQRLPGWNVPVDSPDLDLSKLTSPQPPLVPVPISDDVLREWLSSFQKSRAGAQLSPTESDQAAKANTLFKLLSSEAYWSHLLSADDFVLRQALYCLLILMKKRPRLRFLLGKIHALLKDEVVKARRVVDSEQQVKRVTRQCRHAYRWSSLRASIMAGHQDPSTALIRRIESEYPGAVAAFTNAPAPTAVPGANAPTTNPAARLYFCLVCFGPEIDNINPLVTCSRCSVKVHKNCYGIGHPAQLDLDSIEWFCGRCDIEKKSHAEFIAGSARCAVCLRPGGALKRMSGLTNKSFVHVTCGLWSFPFIQCHDLHRLTDWRFQTADLKRVLDSPRPCAICACKVCDIVTDKAGSPQFTDDAERDAEDVRWAMAQAALRLDKTPSQELPLARVGYTLKCDDCERHMHPMCAWLSGLRVEVHDDYAHEVPCEPGLILPALRIKLYCPLHSATAKRLPTATIAQHRNRAYLHYDTLAEQSLPSTPDSKSDCFVDVSQSQGSPVVLISQGPPDNSKELPSASDAAVVARAETGTAAYFPALAVARSVLAGRDTYKGDMCQACLTSSSEESCFVKCEQCEVRCHVACQDGIFCQAKSSLCTFCRAGSVVHCAVCPRIGGALCEVSRAVVAALLHEDPQTYLKSSLSSCIHKYCLKVQIDKQFHDLLDRWLAVDDPHMFQQKGKAITQMVLQSMKDSKNPLHRLRSTQRICQICQTKEGSFLECSASKCKKFAHPLCAGLAGCVRQRTESSPPEPPAKRARFEPRPARCLCLLHSYEDASGCCGLLDHIGRLTAYREPLQKLQKCGLVILNSFKKFDETSWSEVCEEMDYVNNEKLDLWKRLALEAAKEAVSVAAVAAEGKPSELASDNVSGNTTPATLKSESQTLNGSSETPGSGPHEATSWSSRRKRKRTVIGADSDDEDDQPVPKALTPTRDTSKKRRVASRRGRNVSA